MNVSFTDFSEAYQVVKTVKVVSDQDRFKIDILEDLRSGDLRRFSVEVSQELPVSDRPAHSTQRSDGATWVRVVDFPWVRQDTVDSALSQALGFLRERLRA
jgi:hypothetical protein